MVGAVREGVLETSGGRRVGWLLRGPQDGRVVGYFHGQPGSRREALLFPDDVLARFGIRLLAIDRAGYGDTSPAGLDRRVVAGDLMAVADHLGVGRLAVMGGSMGGVYALALAAVAPERVSRVVLVSGHVLPYDDPAVVAALSPSEQADVALLVQGRTPEVESAYADMAAAMTADVEGLVRQVAQGWGAHEQRLLATPWLAAVAGSVTFGLAAGHHGLLEDGLRTVSPLEFDVSDVRCPVRAVHGTIDDLEPFANLERLAARLADCAVFALPGMGHFGPWLWPDAILGLVVGH